MSRTLGIISKNLKTKKAQNIVPSDFEIAGLLGRFRRQYNRSFQIVDPNNIGIIFGPHLESQYGHDTANGFFGEAGVGKLYVKSHIGNTGSVIDAVTAFATQNDRDGSPQITIKFEDGYRGDLAYGTQGNKTGYTITNGARYSTVLTATIAASDTEAEVNGVSQFRIGDLVKFDVTSGPVYHKLIGIDEANSKIQWTGVFDATLTGAIDDAVEAVGLQVRTFLKNDLGVVGETEKKLGDIFVTLEPEVTEFYIDNVMKGNQSLVIKDQSSTNLGINAYPSDVSTVTYLAAGTDGTAPTTSAHWQFNHAAFNSNPIRMIGNSDSLVAGYNDDLETYLRNRTRQDFPIAIILDTKAQSFQTLLNAGASFQRSEAILEIWTETWLKVTDPFSDSPVAPKREIPNVGHVMGAWIRTIRENGIHWIPATSDILIRTAKGVVEYDETIPLNDVQRTSLFDAGVNIIQDRPGIGIQIRNFVTGSTLQEFKHGNSLIMRNFIRESVRENLTDKENEPNVFTRIKKGTDKILIFMNSLWRNGSTGGVPEGETFGQLIDPETDTATGPDDHFEVIADSSNNPIADLVQGDRDYDIFFTVPTPTGSIQVGVGLILLS